VTILQILAVQPRYLKAKIKAKDKLPVSSFNQKKKKQQI
jgi:hypothetical protein